MAYVALSNLVALSALVALVALVGGVAVVVLVEGLGGAVTW
ncbi:hypothetical protein O1M63_31855 [Streptomyces mirabilis]|nr:hypothetical protein [Streptomyces mirabilis]